MLEKYQSALHLVKSSPLNISYQDYAVFLSWIRCYHHSPSTYNLYYTVVFKFLVWLLYNQVTLKTVSRIHLLSYQHFLSNIPNSLIGSKSSMSSNNWKPFNKQLSSKTISIHLTIINSFMMYLYHTFYIKNNVFFRKIKQSSVTNNNSIDDKCFTKKELWIILRYVYALPQKSVEQKISKTRLTLLLKLLLYVGCRRTEIAMLKSSDITIRHNKLWLRVFGKGSKVGYVPLQPSIFRLINKYRQLHGQPDLFYLLGVEQNIPLLMMQTRPSDQIKPINGKWVYTTIKSLLTSVSKIIDDPITKNKLRKATPHWFRHTCATMQADSGIDIRFIKENMRHSSIETTMLYVHTDKDRQYYETVTKFGLGAVDNSKNKQGVNSNF